MRDPHSENSSTFCEPQNGQITECDSGSMVILARPQRSPPSIPSFPGEGYRQHPSLSILSSRCCERDLAKHGHHVLEIAEAEGVAIGIQKS